MITSTERGSLTVIADRLGVPFQDLYDLINFESGFNPQSKNINSSARGLIQFTDKTAISLGYKNSADLVSKNPTIIDQLPIVERYLMQFMPFPSRQSLFMAVFYPAARTWPITAEFPQFVLDSNPGIRTIADYMKKTSKGGDVLYSSLPLIAVGLIVFLLFKKGIL
jgi:hypothetical protein